MNNTFRYTNKGAVYEFDTNVLSDEEKQKFRKLNDRDKVRYIAARELEQDTKFPQAYSVQAVYNEPQNEKYNTYAIAASKLDDLKKFFKGDLYADINTPLIYKTEEEIMEPIYKMYEGVFSTISTSFNTWDAERRQNFFNELPAMILVDQPKNPETMSDFGWEHYKLEKLSKEGLQKKLNIIAELYNKHYPTFEQYYNQMKHDKLVGKDLKDIILYYCFSVPKLLQRDVHITMSDINKLLSVKPKATMKDLMELYKQNMTDSNVYTSTTISLSEALKNILKKPDPKYWKDFVLNPLPKTVDELIVDKYKDNTKVLTDALNNNVEAIRKVLNEDGYLEALNDLNTHLKETSETISQMNKIVSELSEIISTSNTSDTSTTQMTTQQPTVNSSGAMTPQQIENIIVNQNPEQIKILTDIVDKFFNWNEMMNAAQFEKVFNVRPNSGKKKEKDKIKTSSVAAKNALTALYNLIGDTIKPLYDKKEQFTPEQYNDMVKEALSAIYLQLLADKDKYYFLSNSKRKQLLKDFPILTDDEKILIEHKNQSLSDKNMIIDDAKDNIQTAVQDKNRNSEEEVKEGEEENVGEGVGGKFLNRFKDFEPDINRLESKISNIETILSRLEEDFKKKETEERTKPVEETYEQEPEQEVPEGYVPLQPQPNSLPFSAADLSQGASSLRSFIPYVKPENEEQSDILNILKKRRQDIEPDEYEDLEGSEDEDWGAGSKKIKLLKFINKHKLKKRFKIKDSSSSSSDDSSSDDEEED